MDGYLLVFAGLLLTAGGLGDRLGRRRALLYLPRRRAPEGHRDLVRDRRLGRGHRPVAGGFLIESVDWHGIFLINVPIAAACVIGALRLVPESRDEESARLDWLGAVLSIAALTALVWALIEAPERGWTSAVILAAFATSILFATAFVAWERRTPHPLLEVSVFSNRRFSAASASIAFISFALMGVLYFLTTYLQSVLGLSALDAGLRMLGIAFGIMLAAKSSVRLVATLGTKVVVAAGLVAVGPRRSWARCRRTGPGSARR